MSSFSLEGDYIQTRLSQPEIDMIPSGMRCRTTLGLFMMLANCDECHLLEEITGEDLSTMWGDWFIVELEE